ncbi:hypothetical protein Tco_0984736 [Tanacetum coccineum]
MHVTRQGANDVMTPKSIQAVIDRAIQRNSTHTQDDGSHNSGGRLRRPVQPARVCSYTDFMKCQPLNFKGTKGVVGLFQWLKKMESGTLKKKLTDKYYPKGEIKKLEIELWNLRVRGNDVVAYTQRDFYHEEFADGLAHIISPPEYDHFYFKIEPELGNLTMDVVNDIFPTREPRDSCALIFEPPIHLGYGFHKFLVKPIFAYILRIFPSISHVSVDPPYSYILGGEVNTF